MYARWTPGKYAPWKSVMDFRSQWKSNSQESRQKGEVVADFTLDKALPVVRSLAGRKASAFVRRYRLAIDEHEDVQSHLVLSFIARWSKFDGDRASVQTFASRLMDKELMSILRYRLA